jgi:hypothetical protein
MPLGRYLGRLILFSLAFALPPAVIGMTLAQLPGLLAAEILAALAMVFSLFRAEPALIRAFRAQEPATPGIHRSLERVIESLGGVAPEILVFGDTAAQALTVRSPFSHGTILVSEGLLGVLTEAELRQLLTASVNRLRARGMVFRSMCAWWAQLALWIAPRPWVELAFGKVEWHEALRPAAALRFLTSYSIARFFARLGRVTESDAPQSYRRLSHWLGGGRNPGTAILHLDDPWSL